MKLRMHCCSVSPHQAFAPLSPALQVWSAPQTLHPPRMACSLWADRGDGQALGLSPWRGAGTLRWRVRCWAECGWRRTLCLAELPTGTPRDRGATVKAKSSRPKSLGEGAWPLVTPQEPSPGTLRLNGANWTHLLMGDHRHSSNRTGMTSWAFGPGSDTGCLQAQTGSAIDASESLQFQVTEAKSIQTTSQKNAEQLQGKCWRFG